MGFIPVFIIIVNEYLLRTYFELQIQIKTNYIFLLTGYFAPGDAELDPAGGLKFTAKTCGQCVWAWVSEEGEGIAILKLSDSKI